MIQKNQRKAGSPWEEDPSLPATLKANTSTLAPASSTVILPRSSEESAVLFFLAFPAFLQGLFVELTANAPSAAFPAL